MSSSRALTPFCRKSLNIGDNTKCLNCRFDSLRSLTSRVFQLNEVCQILEEKKIEKMGHAKNWKLEKGRKIGSIPSWRGPLS
jgi:hypothetical protein